MADYNDPKRNKSDYNLAGKINVPGTSMERQAFHLCACGVRTRVQ